MQAAGYLDGAVPPFQSPEEQGSAYSMEDVVQGPVDTFAEEPEGALDVSEASDAPSDVASTVDQSEGPSGGTVQLNSDVDREQGPQSSASPSQHGQFAVAVGVVAVVVTGVVWGCLTPMMGWG